MRKILVLLSLVVLIFTLALEAFALDVQQFGLDAGQGQGLRQMQRKRYLTPKKQLQIAGEINAGALIYQVMAELEQDQSLRSKLANMKNAILAQMDAGEYDHWWQAAKDLGFFDKEIAWLASPLWDLTKDRLLTSGIIPVPQALFDIFLRQKKRNFITYDKLGDYLSDNTQQEPPSHYLGFAVIGVGVRPSEDQMRLVTRWRQNIPKHVQMTLVTRDGMISDKTRLLYKTFWKWYGYILLFDKAHDELMSLAEYKRDNKIVYANTLADAKRMVRQAVLNAAAKLDNYLNLALDKAKEIGSCIIPSSPQLALDQSLAWILCGSYKIDFNAREVLFANQPYLSPRGCMFKSLKIAVSHTKESM
jgi:hypothetical protein